MRCSLLALTLLLPTPFYAEDIKKAPLAELAEHALAQSKLTSGNIPFHLKARIDEPKNKETDYRAEIEEYWVSPQKWRRTIHSADFSQTYVVNGDKIYEQDSDDYYPLWIHNFVTAIFDPLPILDLLKQSQAQIMKPSGGERSNSCGRLQMKVGVSVQNSAYIIICFEGSHGLLESVFAPGYGAQFKEYKSFRDKLIPRKVLDSPEPGVDLEATITELVELTNPDENLFSIPQPTPLEEQINSVRVSEVTARQLAVNATDITWPTVRDGKTSGVLSIYISVDRNGHVRETLPLNSDNAQLDDAAREQVMKWRFKTAAVKNVPVQMESVLTFAFSTKIGNPIPVLSDGEARKLAEKTVEAEVPPGLAPPGTTFTLRVAIGEDGRILGINNINHLSSPLLLAGYKAVNQWRFRPYLKNGKPDRFDADITFHVQ